MQDEQEFIITFAIYGGLAFAGLLISVTSIAFGIVVYKKIKDQKVSNKIYEQKRENGQHKGGNGF